MRLPAGITMTYADFRQAVDSLHEAQANLGAMGDDRWMRYHLLSGDGWWVTAMVCMDGRKGNGCSPSITLEFSSLGQLKNQQISNWDEFTADQLAKVVELRRALEAWENGIAPFPDPMTWNGGPR